MVILNPIGGWRDGSAVKGTECSSRGAGFDSQLTQQSITPVPEFPVSLATSEGTWHAHGADIHTGKTQTHKIKNK